MLDVVIGKRFNSQMRLRLERILEDNPWSTRYAEFDICVQMSKALDVSYQFIMGAIKFIQAVNDEAKPTVCSHGFHC